MWFIWVLIEATKYQGSDGEAVQLQVSSSGVLWCVHPSVHCRRRRRRRRRPLNSLTTWFIYLLRYFHGMQMLCSADQIRLESLSGGWMNDLYRRWNIKNITIINLFGILFVSQFCFWCRANGNFDFSPKFYWLIREGNNWMRDELSQRFVALLSPSSCLISLWITSSSLNAL